MLLRNKNVLAHHEDERLNVWVMLPTRNGPILWPFNGRIHRDAMIRPITKCFETVSIVSCIYIREVPCWVRSTISTSFSGQEVSTCKGQTNPRPFVVILVRLGPIRFRQIANNIMFRSLFLVSFIFGIASAGPFDPFSFAHQSEPRDFGPCSGNTASTRSEWCDYSIDTDYDAEAPDTGVTREYWVGSPLTPQLNLKH